MDKVCSSCKQTLDETLFNWKIKDTKRASHCKKCSRQYIKNHYINNQEYYLAKAKKRNEIQKKLVTDFIADYLLKHPCIDCGENDILVLEFDHTLKKDKFDEVSRMIKRKISLITLQKEVSKCDVRCANCHRRKTAKENNNWKLKYAPVA